MKVIDSEHNAEKVDKDPQNVEYVVAVGPLNMYEYEVAVGPLNM